MLDKGICTVTIFLERGIIMSTNHRPSVPSRDELLAFANTMKERLEAKGLTPEQAVDKSPKVREVLIKAYLKTKQERDSEELAQAEDAAVDMLEEEFFGVTPEMKRQQSVKDWVMALARWETDQLPANRTDAEGNNLCATSEIVPCCDGQSQVGSYAIMENTDGEEVYYGICEKMRLTYKATVKACGEENLRLAYRSLADTKRLLEERKQVKPVVRWVYDFASGNVTNLPVQRQDEEGNYLCGLPDGVPCCDRTQPAKRFSLYKGTIYGVCEKANRVYYQCLRDTGVGFMRTTDDLKKLEGAAAAQADFQAKDLPLRNWVDRFVSSETAQTDEEPVIRHISDDDHTLCCGLPESIPCCDKTKPATAFPTLNGVVYGICGKAAWAYCEGRKRHNDPDCLKFTKDIKQAEYFAQKWCECNLGYDNNVDSGPKSPLGNETSPDGRKKSEQRKRERSERDRQARANKPKPNEGSGDIAKAFMNKKK